MSSDFEYFVGLVDSADLLSSRELREALLSRPVDFWEPSHFWDWKGENFQKVAHLRALLKEIDEAFRDHPDFSDRKEAMFADFERFRTAVDGLKFNSLSENWIDDVPGIEL